MDNQPTVENTYPVKKRVGSIDLLRGVVIVIMAIDHIRDMLHNEANTRNALDPATSYPLLYFTRYITHFCAPNFVMLAGVSAYLVSLRRSPAGLQRFLISRGLWLVVVEVLVITLGITFNIFYNFIILQVIWVIGISFILLGLISRVGAAVIFWIGVVILALHNLVDYAEAARNNQLPFIWELLHGGPFRVYPLWPGHYLTVVYSLVPWTGILFFGFGLGRLFAPQVEAAKRKRTLMYSGIAMLALFVLLRWSNVYGNPQPWTPQENSWRTLMSFFNVNKYPPSLLFTLVTIGPALIFLSLAETAAGAWSRVFSVFGRVPMFFYICHWYLIHLITVIAFYATGHTNDQIVDPDPNFAFMHFRPATFGFSLGVVYLIWLLVILIMYPLCRRYDRYKRTHTHWWLSYL